ncbi:MAG: hypothetical protein WC809_20975 [Sinimarinibacterium sp.]|jgi:predicted secreted protein
MKTRRIAALWTFLALAAAPPAAQAGGADRAINACAAAFVDQQLSNRTVVVKKLNPAPSLIDMLARKKHYTVDLEARVKSGKIAQARCIASLQGKVIKLDSLSAGVKKASGEAPPVEDEWLRPTCGPSVICQDHQRTSSAYP